MHDADRSRDGRSSDPRFVALLVLVALLLATVGGGALAAAADGDDAVAATADAEPTSAPADEGDGGEEADGDDGADGDDEGKGGDADPALGDLLDLGVRDVLDAVEPTVVSIDAGSGAGTGIVVSEDGEVVTNAHVVASSRRVEVTFDDGTTRAAEVLGIDTAVDVALLQVEDVEDLPVATFADDEDVRVGDPVVAIGNALALDGGLTVTYGIVSALDRDINVPGASLRGLVQTDAAINRGNSGGPLVGADARVVGINTAAAGSAENIGFAVAAGTVQDALEDLRAGGGDEPGDAPGPDLGDGPLLGVAVVDAEPGARVVSVVRGGPADEAGIEPGDVITEVDGDAVASAADLVAAIRERGEGDEVALTVERDGEARDLTVSLAG